MQDARPNGSGTHEAGGGESHCPIPSESPDPPLVYYSKETNANTANKLMISESQFNYHNITT